MPPNPPDGYIIVEDDAYIIENQDKYYYNTWGNNDPWNNAITRDFVGMTAKQFLNKNYPTRHDLKLFIAKKGIIKPRFECSKPYPFGY